MIAPSSTPSAKAASERLRVLVVDDNREAAQILSMACEMFGAEARTCHDGKSALEAIGPFSPKLVLLDLSMPDMDGFEVARRIREQPEHASIRVIALTGFGQEEVREESKRAGFDEHLVKPIDIDQLQRVLDRATA